ncbi:hypothetical protein EDD16DRAFT_422310 [Pisolithus croceorrhizus]|nr:hypothetical protein EDD16DRAFT_422310 [Pisolithus croceorrhizus]KAI6128531.1 hypothetical protein EV401DRAFT_1930843 [Pisolithus croceorrhizus]
MCASAYFVFGLSCTIRWSVTRRANRNACLMHIVSLPTCHGACGSAISEPWPTTAYLSSYPPADGCPIKQFQVAERILTSSIDNFPVPTASYLQGLSCASSTFSTSHLPVSVQVEPPLDSVTENEVLPIVSPSLDQDLVPVPRYQDLAWNGRHVQVNYFSRSPTVCGLRWEVSRFPGPACSAASPHLSCSS